MSFFFGKALLAVGESWTELIRGGKGGLPFGREVGISAGVILTSSYMPNNGREM